MPFYYISWQFIYSHLGLGNTGFLSGDLEDSNQFNGANIS